MLFRSVPRTYVPPGRFYCGNRWFLTGSHQATAGAGKPARGRVKGLPLERELLLGFDLEFSADRVLRMRGRHPARAGKIKRRCQPDRVGTYATSRRDESHLAAGSRASRCGRRPDISSYTPIGEDQRERTTQVPPRQLCAGGSLLLLCELLLELLAGERVRRIRWQVKPVTVVRIFSRATSPPARGLRDTRAPGSCVKGFYTAIARGLRPDAQPADCKGIGQIGTYLAFDLGDLRGEGS